MNYSNIGTRVVVLAVSAVVTAAAFSPDISPGLTYWMGVVVFAAGSAISVVMLRSGLRELRQREQAAQIGGARRGVGCDARRTPNKEADARKRAQLLQDTTAAIKSMEMKVRELEGIAASINGANGRPPQAATAMDACIIEWPANVTRLPVRTSRSSNSSAAESGACPGAMR